MRKYAYMYFQFQQNWQAKNFDKMQFFVSFVYYYARVFI